MPLLLALLSAPALAFESTPSEVVFDDFTNIYEGATSSTGWVPSGSPIQVKIENTSAGGALVEMEGESWLEWPDPLTHGYEPAPGTGIFLLDTELGISADLQFDIGGYTWGQNLYSSSDVYGGETTFDPWLLPNGDPQVAEILSPGKKDRLFDYKQSVFTGVELYVQMDWRSDIVASFQGIQIATGPSVIDEEGGFEIIPVPTTGALEEKAVFTGLYGAAVDLVFTPSFGVCIPIIGCTEVGAFDIELPMVDTEVEKDFMPVDIYHPLPQIEALTTECDFGEVEVGEIATCEVKVMNLGELPVEALSGIQGAGEFTVFPGTIYANAGAEDGLVVTFAPTVAGDQEAVLILNTSDPTKLAFEIPLYGSGWSEDEDTGDTMETIPAEVGVCGCSSQPAPTDLAWLVPLAGLLLMRRRRRDDEV